VKLDLWTVDVGAPVKTPEEAVLSITKRLEESWDSGADLVVFPEFCWMLLERFAKGNNPLREVAERFQSLALPEIDKRARPGKAAVLGSLPFAMPDGSLRNRSPILCGTELIYQDKINLTPWESEFCKGDSLKVWTFAGHRIAVMVCLDVEIPELAVALRGKDVDLVIVPSATESLLGMERIERSASARAVELCCYAAVCHLVGKVDSELVDENLGQLAVFHPSQSAFVDSPRRHSSGLVTAGFHQMSMNLDMSAPAAARKLLNETNPSRVCPGPITVHLT
jgi:predicted amidohydrolase